MPTSSITHNFVISDPNAVERFVNAIDSSMSDPTPRQTLPGRQLTDTDEILAFMARRNDWSSRTMPDASIDCLDKDAVALARQKYKERNNERMNRPDISKEVDSMTDE